VALKEHVASVRNHIRELGRKDYQQLPGVRTLDYVLMFVAVEPAFLTAGGGPSWCATGWNTTSCW
jgi:DNA recombination protein RmuC